MLVETPIHDAHLSLSLTLGLKASLLSGTFVRLLHFHKLSWDVPHTSFLYQYLSSLK